jgi:ParB/RepB/Spo0J family partition protein
LTILTPIAVSSAPLLRAIHAGGDLSAKALAEASGRKSNNISRDLSVLEKAGLITREPGSPPALTVDGVAVLAELDGGASTTPGFGEFDINLIDQDPTLNPRVIFDDEELDGLAASIRDKGVTQPILIRQGVIEGRYRIVAGERRWRASRKAEKTTIPAMYRELTDAQAFEIATIENIQRTDLSPLEEARAFRRIIDTRMAEDPSLELKDAKATIADAVRKTVRYVEQRMDLLELPAITQVRLELDKDDNGHLSLKEARREVQNLRARERDHKAKTLPPAELLAMAEIQDACERFPENLDNCWYSTKPIAVGFRALEEGEPIQALLQRDFLTHCEGWKTDPRHLVCMKWPFTADNLEAQLPGFKGKKTRAAALHSLRVRVLGETEAARIAATWDAADVRGEYGTWALNEPFRSEPAPDLIEKAREAEQAQARQQAADFDRRTKQLAEEERRAAKKAAEETMVARDSSDEGRAFFTAVRELERAAPGLDHAAFTAAFSATYASYGIAGPFTLVLTEGSKFPEMIDGRGDTTVAAAWAFEARRRLSCIAHNYALGLPIHSGEDLDTAWSRPPEPEPDALPSRAEFLGMVAGNLEENLEISEGAAASMAEAGLVAFLLQEGVAYGDDGYDWHYDGAMALTELIQIEGLGMDDEPEQIDLEEAIEAQADEEATPDYLRNLAGPGADAEAR